MLSDLHSAPVEHKEAMKITPRYAWQRVGRDYDAVMIGLLPWVAHSLADLLKL